MERLSELESPAVVDRKKSKQERVVQLSETKSRQVLVVTNDDELAAYQLDTEGRRDGEKMADGVLLGRLGDRTIVCFVELKSHLRTEEGTEDPSARALAQLASATQHFHPFGRGGGEHAHGDDHHDAWRDGEDELAVRPASDHEVIELVVAYRAVPRRPAEPPRRVGATLVHRKVVQVSPAIANRAEKSLVQLLQLAGLSE